MLLQTITAAIVAVAPIQVEPYQDTQDWAPTLYEHLTNSVAQYATVVERDQLDKVIKEQNLGMTGLIDESTVARAGMLLGAKYMIISKVTEKNSSSFGSSAHTIYLELSSRLVKIETGETVRGVTASGEYYGKRRSDALSKAAKDLSYQLAIGLFQEYPVIIKRDRNTVYINRGGLPKGAVMTAWEDMGEYYKKTGEVEIIESFATWSEGRIAEGKVRKGNLLNPNVLPVKMYLSYSQRESDVFGVMHKLSLSGYLFGRGAKGLIIGGDYGKTNEMEAVIVSFGIAKSYNILPGRFQLLVVATSLGGNISRNGSDAVTAGGSLEGGAKLKLFQDLWVNGSVGVSKYIPASRWKGEISYDAVDLSQQFVRLGVEIAF